MSLLSFKQQFTQKQFEIPEEQITLPSSLQDSIIETTTPYDPKLVKDFLQGEHCLYGVNMCLFSAYFGV